MIISGTAFESAYRNGSITPFTLEQYTDILCKFIMYIRPQQHIHRLVADSKREHGLIAPLWCENKAGAITFINEYMERHGVVQGSRFVVEE
jgi:radical SAM superfamily enzyme